MKPSKTTSLPKISATVFVKAAELIADETQDFACCAIDEATDAMADTIDGPHTIYFENVLRPRNRKECRESDSSCIRSGFCVPWYGDTQDNRMARVIGLLLCAELAKDGFKPTPYKVNQ